jgi:hypothetical protein
LGSIISHSIRLFSPAKQTFVDRGWLSAELAFSAVTQGRAVKEQRFDKHNIVVDWSAMFLLLFGPLVMSYLAIS